MIRLASICLTVGLALPAAAAEPTAVVELWPAQAPGEPKEAGPEREVPAKPGQRPVIRLTDVSRPTLSVFLPPKEKQTGVGVVIAPGGGYSILAWDLEGTEVAEWLNSIGIAAAVLKYRVPKRPGQTPTNLAALQDAQRAVSVFRSRAAEWGVDPARVGMLGFSAGGNLTVATCTAPKRVYDVIDKADEQSPRPAFAVLIYPAYLAERGELKADYPIDKTTPPMFLAHAHNDGVSPENSAVLYLALKKAGVPAELHIYETGGHGFGLRASEHPASTWPARAADWFKTRGIVK